MVAGKLVNSNQATDYFTQSVIETTRSERADKIVDKSKLDPDSMIQMKIGHRVTNSFGSSVGNPRKNTLFVGNERIDKENTAYIDGQGSESVGSSASYPRGYGESQGPKVMSTNVSVAHNDLLLGQDGPGDQSNLTENVVKHYPNQFSKFLFAKKNKRQATKNLAKYTV